MNGGIKRKLSIDHENNSEDDTMECTICSENWTETGPHRLVSLKCGHLYGEMCIVRWIDRSRGPKAHCPHCKQPVKMNDLRPVLPIKLAAKDTTEIELLRKELEATKATMVERQYQLENSLLALSMSQREIQKLTASMEKFNVKENHTGDTKRDTTISKRLQHYRTEYLPMKDVGPRVMALYQQNRSVIVSTKEKDQYGVHIYSLDKTGQDSFLPIHSGAIRDIKCQNDLLLSCGHDKTLKLTSIKDKQLLNTFPLSSTGWSCSFHLDDPSSHFVYCGLANDTTLIYDRRQPQTPLHRLQNRSLTGGSPIYSIIPSNIAGTPLILCGNLNKVYAWKFDNPLLQPSNDQTINDAHCHIFTLEDMEDFRPYSLTTSTIADSFLISLRRHNSSKHIIGTINSDLTIDVHHSFGYPYHQKWVTRTIQFDTDVGSVIGYSNDEHETLCLHEHDKIGMEKTYPIGERIFDIGHCSLGDVDSDMVAVLTASKLHLYRYM
ncbi:uncharacterized protein BX664DRAFT_359595 [Halteromyces radiatus]|uniref:uncharacterized protein n=1 Tax=Halteromyces radiatus TaxID=101107 RepID=UPI00222051DD|nr:uncharacterized protein BX664DRAFT_359595 [Halteromyces radiatus]KAI8086030.1 hypothetical protein BX664DRAFT_359595 [Halteromyces radiatus]